MKLLILALTLIGISFGAQAKTCIPFPQCNGGFAPTPVTPGSLSETEGVIGALLEVQAKFVADVNNAAVRAALPLPGVTPSAPVDPYGVVCFPALASWAQGLKPLGTLPVDGSPDKGPVSVFEDARILVKIGISDAQQIQTNGLPFSIVQGCGGYLLDIANTGAQVVGTLAGFNALIAKWIPAPVLIKHNVGHLAPHVPS